VRFLGLPVPGAAFSRSFLLSKGHRAQKFGPTAREEQRRCEWTFHLAISWEVGGWNWHSEMNGLPELSRFLFRIRESA